MAVQYMIVCLFDFVFFPAFREMHNVSSGSFHEWKSLTLQGGGLYHGAMGAIVGVYAYQKTKEIMASMGASSSTIERTVERSSIVTPADDRTDDKHGDKPATGKSSRAD